MGLIFSSLELISDCPHLRHLYVSLMVERVGSTLEEVSKDRRLPRETQLTDADGLMSSLPLTLCMCYAFIIKLESYELRRLMDFVLC